MALEDIIKNRLKKRKSLQDRGVSPYPIFIKRTHNIAQVLDEFDKLAKLKKRITLAGRLIKLRSHGGLTFGNLKDGLGSVQIAFREDGLGKVQYADIEKSLDIGDFISVEGTLFKTKRGERTVDLTKFSIITKSIRPLPEKWHGLKDVEERYRRRYLDILMNEDVARIFKTRSRLIAQIHDYMTHSGFQEVETPVLQFIPGGTSAKPFKTHLNAFDLDMHLRISPELYLKRLLVAGFDKVYELGRNFRNEGVDYSHNPEFTMLEFYWAYSDYKEGMKFTEKFLSSLVKSVTGKKQIEHEGRKINFSTPWDRIEFTDLLHKYAKINYDDYNFEGLKRVAEKLGVKSEKKVYSKAEVGDQIYKKLCLPHIINPTFIIHYPSEMLPLAKPLPDNPDFAASFQVVAAGWELVKAYSELNDPVVQREFFEKQQALRQKGDLEAQLMDEDFVEALEYGMPPAFGFGMGIDRLTALITNSHSLREVILFPTMRPK